MYQKPSSTTSLIYYVNAIKVYASKDIIIPYIYDEQLYRVIN